MIYAPSLRDHVQLGKSLEITNALIAVHVTSQTLYTEITNAVHVTSLPGSLYVCLHFATAHVPMHTDKLT